MPIVSVAYIHVALVLEVDLSGYFPVELVDAP